MRLINARTLELESFDNDADRPEYAILSHRWVDKQEITLHELISRQNQHKSGWQKIRFCCTKALKHGLEWAWVDTCCIDKTSSAELTEAINSMYRWYQSAYVCLAYINDVPKFSKKSFRNSVWFKRSWTLQELLAPRYLRFYDAHFKFMGTKRERLELLESITDVPEEVLESPEKMYALPIARRMSWAATRYATRVEDIAYSLFGIFKVNLPLLYGEGTRAFTRLQEEIVRQSDDQSIFIWNSPGHGPCPCFAASPADFGTFIHLYPIRESFYRTPRKQARAYSVTNVGLHIDCKVIQFTYGIWLAFLPWSAQDDVAYIKHDQYCLFLSPNKDWSNVWQRVKLRNRACCTLAEAIIEAYEYPCWPRQTPRMVSTQPACELPMNRLPMSESAFWDAIAKAEWRSIYVELYPHSETLYFKVLHGIFLDQPSLTGFDHSAGRPFALVSNFDWESSANPIQGLSYPYTSSRPKPSHKVSSGVFALHPLQPGPAGALFFEPPRLGLRGIVIGFGKDFTLTAVFITENARVDVSKLYYWAFPFTTLEDFHKKYWYSRPDDSSNWLTDVLWAAFREGPEKELPEHIYIEWEAEWTMSNKFEYLGRCNWKLILREERLNENYSGDIAYWNCFLDNGSDGDLTLDSRTLSERADDEMVDKSRNEASGRIGAMEDESDERDQEAEATTESEDDEK